MANQDDKLSIFLMIEYKYYEKKMFSTIKCYYLFSIERDRR